LDDLGARKEALSFRYDQAMIEVQELTVDSFCRYGWLLGKPFRLDRGIPTFRNADIDFWEEQRFDSGVSGEPEILWVNYRNRERTIASLEVHRLTQQVVVPLTGEIIQIVAMSQQDGSPDMSSLRAFRIPISQGVCMQPGCWHTTRVDVPEVQCLMLTRRSTTIDLIAHLNTGTRLAESEIAAIDHNHKAIALREMYSSSE
jgi:ureidoglycolate lyase